MVTRTNRKIDNKADEIIEEVATKYSKVFKGLAKYDKREKQMFRIHAFYSKSTIVNMKMIIL